ncbi:MAG TPA: MFS transporter [Candidatus Binataceae bacterium]|jgi:MFS family permease|nr:MFS transporter [Candidatus Binataceae bacterium]
MTSRERQGWVIVGGFFMAEFFIVGAGYDTAGVFFTPLLRHFGWTRTQLSMLTSAISLAAACAGPGVGWLLDRTEAKWVVTAGAALCGLAFVMASMAHGLVWMVCAYALLGFGAGASAMAPCYYVIGNWFVERRALAMTVAVTGIEVGGMVMALVAAYLVVHAGWRTTYLVLAAPVLLFVVPTMLLLVRSRPDTATGATAGAHGPHGAAGDAQSGLEVATALRERSFWLIAISYLTYAFGATALIVHLVPYLIGTGMTAERAAVILSITLGLNMIGKPAFGAAADRFGIRLVYGLNLWAVGCGILCLLYARNAPMLVLFAVVYGLSVGAPIGLMPAILADSVGLRRFGSLSGLLVTLGVIGSAAGPIAAGAVFDRTASYIGIFVLFAVALLIAGFLPIACVSYQERTASAAPVAQTAS